MPKSILMPVITEQCISLPRSYRSRMPHTKKKAYKQNQNNKSHHRKILEYKLCWFKRWFNNRGFNAIIHLPKSSKPFSPLWKLRILITNNKMVPLNTIVLLQRLIAFFDVHVRACTHHRLLTVTVLDLTPTT